MCDRAFIANLLVKIGDRKGPRFGDFLNKIGTNNKIHETFAFSLLETLSTLLAPKEHPSLYTKEGESNSKSRAQR